MVEKSGEAATLTTATGRIRNTGRQNLQIYLRVLRQQSVLTHPISSDSGEEK